ncbi:MAG TPA: DUF4352 domain-containing protein [Solirubrobacteraceae bacterium]
MDYSARALTRHDHPERQHPRRRATAPATGLIGVIGASVVVALAGAALAVRIALPGPDNAPALPKGPFGIHQQVPMSFGSVAVDVVEKLGAVPFHGPRNTIAGDVPPGRIALRTTVSVSNLLDRSITYSPASFRLLVGAKKRPISLTQSTMPAGRLNAGSVIEGRLSFVVPERARSLWLEVRDPGRRSPVLIDLRRAGRTPTSAFDRFGHLHPGGTR